MPFAYWFLNPENPAQVCQKKTLHMSPKKLNQGELTAELVLGMKDKLPVCESL